jgi:alpha-tubulin suppressor-like RCC1 family protein
MNSLQLSFFGIILVSLTLASANAQDITPQVAVGKSQSVIISDQGKVYTFGSGSYGSLGQSSLTHNEIATALTHSNLNGYNIIDIAIAKGSTSDTFTLLLADDGTVFSFGNNIYGQLGHGDQVERFEPTPITHDSLTGVKIIDIQAGNRHSVLLSDSGDVYVMGSNSNGYLGIGATTPGTLLVPTKLTHSNLNGYTISKIAAGGTHTFLQASNDTLFAFGGNSNGQLGDGTTVTKTIPTIINSSQFDGKTVSKMSIDQGTSLFLMADSTVYSWGNFRAGLGQGILGADILNPAQITHSNINGRVFVDVSKSSETGFLIDKNGAVFTFGEAEAALPALGLNTNEAVNFPTEIPASSFNNKKISKIFGSRYHTLFLAEDGSVFSAGRGLNGELGSRYSDTSNKVMRVDSLNYQGDRIIEIGAANNASLLLSNSGKVYSFGGSYSDSTSSFLGRTSKRTIARPQELSHSNISGKTFVKAAAAGERTFLLSEDGKVYAFGSGVNGILGTGDSLNIHVPTLIDHTNIGSKKIVDIKTTSNRVTSKEAISHTLLLAEDGTLFGFGSNKDGQLGLGDFVDRSIPTEISHANLSGKTISEIAVGAQNSMVITNDGTVFIWGRGGNGEMGYGNTNTLNVPTEATHLTALNKTFITGSVGQTTSITSPSHFIVIASDSTVYGFGENTDGQLGLGNKTDTYTPTQLTSSNIVGKKPIAVSAGIRTTMLLMQDGSVYSFGNTSRVGIEGASFTDKTEPTLLNNTEILGKKIISISSHDGHGLAVLDDGTVLSFGVDTSINSRLGALGNGLPESGDETPQPIVNFNWLTSPIPTTNLAVHLDAGRGLTTFGDSLNTWGDLGSSGNDGTQTTQARRAVIADSAINNKQAIRFNGSNSYVTLPTTSSLGIQNSDYEVFIVAKSRISDTDIHFLMAGSTLEQYELHLNGDAGARFIPNSGNFVDEGTAGDFSDGEAQLYNLRATNTYGSITINRALATIESINARNANDVNLYLGVRTDNSFTFDGDIAEVIIYSSILSDNDRRKVESYLFKKYAIKNYKESSQQLTGSEGWRIMSSPVADSSFAPLLGSFWTQGFTGANHSGGASNVYRWPNTSTDLSNTNWISVSNMSDSLHPGEGVLVYVYSDDNGPGVAGNAGFPKTLKLEGREPEGTQTITPLLNANVNGWALVGNPFRNDIDWDGFTRSGLSNSVYVYDINSASWKSWNGTLGSLTDGEVGPFNAFFVQTTEVGPSLSIPESAKTDSAKRFLGKQISEINPHYFSLEFKNDSGFANKAWFQFSEEGEFGIDASDAHQLNPLSSNYVTLASILNDTTHLDINSLPIITEPLEISLALQTSASGTAHHISKGDLNIPEGWEVSLYDSELDITTDLAESYEFTMNAAKVKTVQDVKSPPSLESVFKTAKQKRSGSRFTLTVSPSQAVSNEAVIDLPREVELGQNYPNPFNPSTTIAYGVPNTGKVTLEVFDILGRKVATLLNGENKTAGRYTLNFNASNLASGMYIYRLRAGNIVITKKLTLIK